MEFTFIATTLMTIFLIKAGLGLEKHKWDLGLFTVYLLVLIAAAATAVYTATRLLTQ